jgi:hypothetical protein
MQVHRRPGNQSITLTCVCFLESRIQIRMNSMNLMNLMMMVYARVYEWAWVIGRGQWSMPLLKKLLLESKKHTQEDM